MNIAIYITGVTQGKTVTEEDFFFPVFHQHGDKW
jgi:hypothetical protein